MQRDQGKAGLGEGEEETAVVSRSFQENFVAGYRAGDGIEERDDGGHGTARGDSGEGGSEELGFDGGLVGIAVPELGWGKDDGKGC